uniref:Exonuclease domain-containing protein n=1 Tax=Gasterosteus aculeatus aculeatus TaxID=481459 RepID=A0AAQ4RSK3_GASAC
MSMKFSSNPSLSTSGQKETSSSGWRTRKSHRHQLGDPVTSCHIVAGEQNCYAVNDEAKDDSLQELERINKEIETVRHEVEQEQRRLSRYQTVLADDRKPAPSLSASKSEAVGKKMERGPSSCAAPTRSSSRGKKYVVDNSKPRTDLEYDPLSNFSAGLRSCGSSGKEQKGKNGRDLKRERNVTDEPPPSRLPSSEPLDDSNEDDDLIIDIPPSPDKKRRTPGDVVSGKLIQNQAKVKTQPVLPLNACEATTLPSPKMEKMRGHSNCNDENIRDLFGLYERKECEAVPVDGGAIDLTGYLEEVQTRSLAEKVVAAGPEPASPPATADQQDANSNHLLAQEADDPFQVDLSQWELPHCVGDKMDPLQPHRSHPKNSLFDDPPGANSDSPGATRVRSAEQRAQNWLSNQWLPEMPQSQDAPAKVPGQAPTEPAWSNGAELITGQLFVTEVGGGGDDDEEEVIRITSSSDEDELKYSEAEFSDSDPMEECYRIFMEANEERGDEKQPDVSVAADVEKPKLSVKPQALPGKRVAHDAKHTELPVVKSRPQPQVLVPLRAPAVSGFTSRPSTTCKVQQVQHRAAALKGGQAFVVSSSYQRKPETHSASLPSTQPPENLQSAPVQNAHMNYISLGTAVIGVDNNLHLILPEGLFPLPASSGSGHVTSVLTPISQVTTSAVAVRQMYHAPAVTPLQRYRTTAPVLIPAPARKPSLASAFASSPAASAAPQAAVHAAVKPVPTKRKLKQCEAAKDKVPHEIRQRYVNMFTEEFLKTTANVNEAFEKALNEEKAVYNRSVNKLKYLSVAVNALKKLKNQSAVSAKDENEDKSQRSKGNISLDLNKLKGNGDTALYESLKDYILTEETLVESNFPVQHPENPGCAVLFVDSKKGIADPLKRICCRCGSTYSVNQMGKHTRKEECNYHHGKGVTKKVPGGVETRYSCCEGVMGAPGCQVFQVHVHDFVSLEGFVSTVPRLPSDTSCPGVYSLDCDMCYTIHGLELSRVTVVNWSLQVVYDTFVRPDNEVIDYNTRFSGVSEEDVKGNRTSLREVQETLLSFVSADTILIGHGLETDLCALKLLHGTVVDTSVVFPHRLGLPHKLTLNNLTAEYLMRIIQESVCGHDTEEDAAACMELMLWRLKEDGKMKK